MDIVMAPRVLSNNHQSCGFTLVETLAALVLLSLVFLLLTSGSRFVMDNDRKAAVGAADVAHTQIFLASLVSQARPALVRDHQSPTGESVAFTGSATRFDLLTSAPSATTIGGLYNVSVLYDETSQQVEIVSGLYRPSDVTYEDKTILMDDVTNAEFTYFGRVRDRIGWYSSWQHALSLPLLVRIRLSFSNESLVWPDLVVPLKVTSHRPQALGTGTF
jgi:prepilin-type N-terminal cleavage/methylation domain-containing protein